MFDPASGSTSSILFTPAAQNLGTCHMSGCHIYVYSPVLHRAHVHMQAFHDSRHAPEDEYPQYGLQSPNPSTCSSARLAMTGTGIAYSLEPSASALHRRLCTGKPSWRSIAGSALPWTSLPDSWTCKTGSVIVADTTVVAQIRVWRIDVGRLMVRSGGTERACRSVGPTSGASDAADGRPDAKQLRR